MENNTTIVFVAKYIDGKTDPETIDLAGLALDQTAMNAIKSPLLRLPAEIRHQIWSLCFRNVVINVDGENRPSDFIAWERIWDPTSKTMIWKSLPRLPYSLTFSTCGPTTDKVCTHISPRDHDRPHPWDKCKYASRVFHPLVCKQFWSETHGMFIGRATWVFFNHEDLVMFIKTKKAVAAHVRKLVIRSDHRRYRHELGCWVRQWQQALTWSKMRHFTRLQGVELHINVQIGSHSPAILKYPAHDPLKSNWKLQAIFRSLQQHKLQADLTTVKLYPAHLWTYQVEATQEHARLWEDAWKDVLLTHVPLGQGPSGGEKKWTRKHLNDGTNRE